MLLEKLKGLGADRVYLSYKKARQKLFSTIDNDQGTVQGVYSPLALQTDKIPSASGALGMNTEHTWPKCYGLDAYGVSDLHHLFPTSSRINNKRGKLPFGVVATTKWEGAESKMGLDHEGRMVFEPPDEHKGNVARALFYVAATYGLRIEDKEEAVLRKWHLLDPVDAKERERNDAIAGVQGNRNPFIDNPQLVKRVTDF